MKANHLRKANSSSMFWWLIRYLLFASIVISGSLWFGSLWSMETMMPFRQIGFYFVELFPGVISLTKMALNPEAWRLYFITFLLTLPYCWFRLESIRILGNSKQELTLIQRLIVFLLGLAAFIGSTWFILFNEKVVDPATISRGSIFLSFFQSSFLGLSLSGWFFFFFWSISVPLILKSMRGLIAILSQEK